MDVVPVNARLDRRYFKETPIEKVSLNFKAYDPVKTNSFGFIIPVGFPPLSVKSICPKEKYLKSAPQAAFSLKRFM